MLEISNRYRNEEFTKGQHVVVYYYIAGKAITIAKLITRTKKTVSKKRTEEIWLCEGDNGSLYTYYFEMKTERDFDAEKE